MGTHWAEILGGCQSRETEQLLPWSFLKFTNKKVVILKFWFILSARARARARSARPPRAGGPGLPHVQKRQVKQVLPRARVEIWRCSSFWFSSNFVCSWGTPSLSAVPYGRSCSLRSAHSHWNMSVLESESWTNLFCSSRPPCLSAVPYGRSCSLRYVNFHWKMSVFKG